MENCIFNPWGHNDMSSLHLIPLLSELIIHPAVTSVTTFISIIKLNLICLVCMLFFRSELLQTAMIHMAASPKWGYNWTCIEVWAFLCLSRHSGIKSRRWGRGDGALGNHWLSHSYAWAVRAGNQVWVYCRRTSSLPFPCWRIVVCDPVGVVSLTDRCQGSSPTDFCCAEVPLCSLMSFSSALYSSLHRSLFVAQPCDAAGCKISGGVQGWTALSRGAGS